MKGECWNRIEQIYLFKCTNPNHSYGVWKKYRSGRWLPVELSKKRESKWTGTGIEYMSGGKVRKIKESHLNDIRSRKSTGDGGVRKEKHEKYQPITWED